MGFLSEYQNITKTEEELRVESLGLNEILVDELDEVAAWPAAEGFDLVQSSPGKHPRAYLGPELGDEACAALQVAPKELDERIADLARRTK